MDMEKSMSNWIFIFRILGAIYLYGGLAIAGTGLAGILLFAQNGQLDQLSASWFIMASGCMVLLAGFIWLMQRRTQDLVQLLRDLIRDPHGCRFCDAGGKLRNRAKRHDDDCLYLRAEKLGISK